MYTLCVWGRSPTNSASLKTCVHPHVYIYCLRQDLDILCLTPYPGGAEAIKKQLCKADDHFYTVRAKNPEDTWNVLWWRTNSGSRFKIDILTPGVLDLPNIHPDYLIKIDKFPCAPLHLLLFHKLKGWDDRQSSDRLNQRAKVPVDAKDIMWLLLIASTVYDLDITKKRSYITNSFRNDSYERAAKFALKCRESVPFFSCLLRMSP